MVILANYILLSILWEKTLRWLFVHEKRPHSLYCTKRALPLILTSFFFLYRRSFELSIDIVTLVFFFLFSLVFLHLAHSISHSTHNTSILVPAKPKRLKLKTKLKIHRKNKKISQLIGNDFSPIMLTIK